MPTALIGNIVSMGIAGSVATTALKTVGRKTRKKKKKKRRK